MKKIRTFLLSICIVLTLISYAGAKEKLIFSVTIIRHGDRTPYAELVNKQFNHLWKEGIGELTPIGMNQEYMLGCYFRERYVRNFKLLSFNYEYNKIYALSTDYNRTIMSAQSFLTGLYPPGTGPKLDNGNYALPFGYQLIPVRTIPTDQKNLINPEKYDNTIYNELMEKYAFTQKIWIDENNKQSENFNRWSEIFGFKVNSLKDLLIPGDHLQCDIDHKVKLPGGISKKEAYEIIKTRLRACAIRFYPKEIAKFIAGPFMKKLSEDLISASSSRQKYKFILYSGHDDSLLGIMSALERPLEFNPPYASFISFELYKNNNEYFVKVFYNKKPVILSNDLRSIISLEEFLKKTAPLSD